MTAYHLRAFARDDLEQIWNYTVKQWGVEQAERYIDILFACFDDLATNPELGRKRDDVMPDYRSFPQGRHVVFYIIESANIEIIGIVHQNADVNHHLE